MTDIFISLFYFISHFLLQHLLKVSRNFSNLKNAWMSVLTPSKHLQVT